MPAIPKNPSFLGELTATCLREVGRLRSDGATEGGTTARICCDLVGLAASFARHSGVSRESFHKVLTKYVDEIYLGVHDHDPVATGPHGGEA